MVGWLWCGWENGGFIIKTYFYVLALKRLRGTTGNVTVSSIRKLEREREERDSM